MTPYIDDTDFTLYVGDVREVLADLPAESVHCCVTSPPYWGLRDYGTGSWEGGCDGCDHAKPVSTASIASSTIEGGKATVNEQQTGYRDVCGKCGARRVDHQLGLEPTPEEYVASMVAVFREVRRVLRRDGTCWLNIGDSYASGKGESSPAPDPKQAARRFGKRPNDSVPAGLKHKDLVGIPWRLAFALQADGWCLRSEIVWSKSNPMPESVTDRPTKAHEQVFLLTKCKWVGPDRGQFAHISDEDARWLALLFDTEGNIVVKRSERDDRTQYGAQIAFSNCSRDLLERAHAIVGAGSLSTRPGTNAPVHYWQLGNKQAADLLYRIAPYLIVKQRQARVAIHLHDVVSAPKKRPGGFRTPEHEAFLEKCWRTVKALNSFESPDLAWVPDLRYGKWSPERYFYDADAIREPAEWARWGDQTNGKHEGSGSAAGWIGSKSKEELQRRGPTWEERKAAGATRANRDPENVDASAVHMPGQSHTLGDGRGRNKRSVWEIATEPYPDAHFACVDERTQALTPLGWKYHDEIRDGDHIATYDHATDSCRFTPAMVHRYDYDGDLVAIEKRDTSQRLTPNHRCLIRHRSGKTAVVEASDLTPGMEVMTVAPLEPDWRDKRTFGDTEPELAALIGWFVAEGHVTSIKRLSIYQSQSANPQHVETIRDLLGVTGGDWTESTRHRAYLGRGGLTATSSEVEFVVRGPLALIMQELAPSKRLHEGVLGMTSAARVAMLDALIDGDGHRRSDGRACIVQKDAHQIGVMQSLALSLGYRAIVSQRKDGNHVLHLTRGRWLTLRSTNGRHVPIGREHYEGIVWCPSVETGFWLARRNGRPFITGNTFPQALVEPCVLAGTSERGCCPVCGAPWERETDIIPASDALRSHGTHPGAKHLQGSDSRLNSGTSEQYHANRRRVETIGWRPTCEHYDKGWVGPDGERAPLSPVPCTVLDPFMGSGTVAVVARRLGRKSIGIELNEAYAALAATRLQQLSLLAEPA